MCVACSSSSAWNSPTSSWELIREGVQGAEETWWGAANSWFGYDVCCVMIASSMLVAKLRSSSSLSSLRKKYQCDLFWIRRTSVSSHRLSETIFWHHTDWLTKDRKNEATKIQICRSHHHRPIDIIIIYLYDKIKMSLAPWLYAYIHTYLLLWCGLSLSKALEIME